MTKVYHRSDKQTWETPAWLFSILDTEFNFTVDVCATDETAKCERYFTPADNGLIQCWHNQVCWCNPPYNDIPAWLKKGYESASAGNATVVYLIPARPDTTYWWDYVLAGEIRFLKGRLKFGSSQNSAPFPSAIVIFRPGLIDRCVSWIDCRPASQPAVKPFQVIR